MLERLADCGHIRRKDHLLDYGCGKGRVAFFMTSVVGCRVTGIDYSQKLIDIAKEDFGDGATDTLADVLERCADRDKACILGGYSLAGLFALWAAYQTDAFSAVAAASPSVWFPGFLDYMRAHSPRAASAYLSLGDKEERTRNPVMATVGERIREAYNLMKAQGVNAILEWNQGNHFRDADLRTARAFAWAMKEARFRQMKNRGEKDGQ